MSVDYRLRIGFERVEFRAQCREFGTQRINGILARFGVHEFLLWDELAA
jgi:hypothetical protein